MKTKNVSVLNPEFESVMKREFISLLKRVKKKGKRWESGHYLRTVYRQCPLQVLTSCRFGYQEAAAELGYSKFTIFRIIHAADNPAHQYRPLMEEILLGRTD